MKTKLIKYESISQAGLFFWAEQNPQPLCVRHKTGFPHVSYGVVQQAKGYPATEAHDDWFATLAEADTVAQQMARGEVSPSI